MIISTRSHAALIVYLEHHEGEIAYGINDFDDLRGVFAEFMERQAEEPTPIVRKWTKPPQYTNWVTY